jgi:hypothetical protein
VSATEFSDPALPFLLYSDIIDHLLSKTIGLARCLLSTLSSIDATAPASDLVFATASMPSGKPPTRPGPGHRISQCKKCFAAPHNIS